MRKTAVFVLILLIVSFSIFAESYTYEDLLAIMNVNNLELLTQDEVIKTASLDVKDAKANYSPTIDLQVSGTYMVNPPSITKDDILGIANQIPALESYIPILGGMLPDEINIIDKPFMYAAQLNLTQPIFTWGKVTNAVKLYEKILEIRQVEKEDKINSLSVELEGYLGGLYYAREILDLLNKAGEDADRLIEIAQSGYENGVMLIDDYNEARLSKSELDMGITEAEVQIASLMDNLEKTVGVDMTEDDFSFVPDEAHYYEVAKMDRMDLRARAVSNANSNIKMASMSVEAAELGEDIAKGSIYGKPDLALQVGLGYTGFVGSGWEHSGDYSLNISVGLQTTLWDGGKVLNNIDRSKSQITSANITLENAKSQLSMTLEENFRNMDLAISRINYYQTRNDVITSELETLNKQHDIGYAGESDILQKQIEIYQNQISLLQEKANLMQASLAVEYIAGLR